MKYLQFITTLFVTVLLGLSVCNLLGINTIEEEVKTLAQKSSHSSDRTTYHSKYSKESTKIRIHNFSLASELIQYAKKKNIILVTAESVSGGNLASSLARSPGAGSVFAGGAVCYKIEAKKELLFVPDMAEKELYDLQTAEDMAKGVQKRYNVSIKNKVAKSESYYKSKIMAIATTGRAVSWKKWEGGVYIAIACPNGKVVSKYFVHNFITSDGKKDRARTKDEGMLIATNKALTFALEIIKKGK